MDNLDSLGVGSALSLFPDQIRETFKQAYASDIPQINPSNIVISGMGGSSNAAKILQGLYESDLKIPLTVFNDYDLPEWVSSDSLVIANSYSGNTEETLSAVIAAKKIGAKVIGVTTGGKLADMIKDGSIDGAIVSEGATNPTHFPKTGLGVSFGALSGTLSKLGIFKLSEQELNDALIDIATISKTWDPKGTAAWFDGGFPVFFGGRPFIGSLNAGRNAMCEISRNYTQFYDFPEVDHVLVEATQKPEASKNNKYLTFVSKFNHPRVLERYKVTAAIFKEQALNFDHYVLKGKTRLAQGLELPYFSALIAYNLSLVQGVDPGPEPWITKLKDSLSQPVH